MQGSQLIGREIGLKTVQGIHPEFTTELVKRNDSRRKV